MQKKSIEQKSKEKKKKSKSKKSWVAKQLDDSYVKKAKLEGYRSRAAYKLLEIQQKDKIIKPGHVVVDLGAAPGSWSQVAVKIAGSQGYVCAIDILPIENISGVDIIQGDISTNEAYQQLITKLSGRPVNIVLSDIAPNLSGNRSLDQARSIYLAELVLDFAIDSLKAGGSLLVKVFQGEGFTEYVQQVKKNFKSVAIRKPKASRAESREVYVLAKQFEYVNSQ